MIQQYHLSCPYNHIDDLGWGGGGIGIYIFDDYFDGSLVISIYYVSLDSGAMGYV